MKAIKGNKEYTINEKQKAFYIDEGYDVIGDDGEVIAYGKGKAVPYETYVSAVKRMEVLEEINTGLRAELEAVRQADGQAAGSEAVPDETAGPSGEGAAAEAKAPAKKGKG